MSDGRVSLKATNATVREILAEWAKVGQARIVNGERLTGLPMTLELTERDRGPGTRRPVALGRGYMAAPRPSAIPNASQFDRILILPTSVAAARRRHAAAAGIPRSRSSCRRRKSTTIRTTRPRGARAQPTRAHLQYIPAAAASQVGHPSRCRLAASMCRRSAADPSPNPGRAGPRGHVGSGHGRAAAAVLSPARFNRSRRMPLVDEVSAAIADAMRKRDPARLSALRMLKAALMNREVEKARALDDTEARQVVASLVKQRKDSIEQFTKGGRHDLAAKETAEIAVLESYLPPAADPGSCRTRRPRSHRRNRRRVAEGHRPRDESRDGQAGRSERRRQDGQRARTQTARWIARPPGPGRSRAPPAWPASPRWPAAYSAWSARPCSPRSSAPATRWTRTSSPSGFRTWRATSLRKAR